MTEKIELDHDSAKKLFGVYDANVKLIEEKLKVRIKTRDGGITVTGGAEDSDKAVGLITALLGLIKNGGEPGRADVLRCLDLAEGDSLMK